MPRLLLALALTLAPAALAQPEEAVVDDDRVEEPELDEEPEPDSDPASQPASRPAPDDEAPAEGDPPPDPELEPEPEPEPEPAPAPEPPDDDPPPPPDAPQTPSEAAEALELPERDLAYYAVWYGPEWGLDALQLALLGLGVYDALPAAGPAIGPSFDPEDPSPLFDPRLDPVIGKPFVREQVSETAAGAGILIAGLAVGTADHLVHGDWHRTHHFALGFTTAISTTITATWGLKLGVGRLRPDFRERYLRAACAGNIETDVPLDCASVDDGFEISADELEKGRRSFPSGHSSLTAAAATYLSLHLGSTFVWGDAVPKRGGWRTASQVGGAAAAGLLIASAGYVASSRVTDHRHHADDVVFGAGIGAALGAASYLLHFELDGSARFRGARLVPLMTDGPGLALQGEF